MSKYEYAYCESERRLIAIADIREDSKKDPHIYMQRYEGHLLCPECKQARLIVVQGADFPFFSRSSEVCSQRRLRFYPSRICAYHH